MKRIIFTFLAVALTGMFSATAQITGKWKTFDDETGEAKSIVHVYEQDGKLYGKVIEILNPANKTKNARTALAPIRINPFWALPL